MPLENAASHLLNSARAVLSQKQDDDWTFVIAEWQGNGRPRPTGPELK